MIRRPPRSTLFPTRRSSDLVDRRHVAVPVAHDGVSRHGRLESIEVVGVESHLERGDRSEEHTSELQSRQYLVCRLLLENKNQSHTIIAKRNDTILTSRDIKT